MSTMGQHQAELPGSMVVTKDETQAKAIRAVLPHVFVVWPQQSQALGRRFFRIVLTEESIAYDNKEWFESCVRTALRPGGKMIWL